MSNPLNGTRPVFVKTVSVLTSVATVLSLSGAAYLAPLAAVAAVPSDYGLTEGNTISASGTNDPDVYIVNALGYKRLFLNPVIFSFYGHLGGFANVKSVSAAARDAFPTSGLFRNCETNAQQVWAVEVTAEDNAVFHKVVMSGDQAVVEDANFFKKVFCINNNEQNWYPKSAVDYTSLSQVPVYSRVPGATPTPSQSYGPLSVSLASSNPASGTIVDGQARYNLAEFMFNGGGTVTNLKLKRLGVSADASLTNVYLYDGTKRLTDSVTVSDGVMTFNDPVGLFTVSGSKVISVIADIDGTSGETIGVQLIGWNSNGVSISGNLHTIATATLATMTFGAVTPIDATDTGTDEDNGNTSPANDVNVWQSTFTVGQRYVWLKSIQMRVIGSIVSGDVTNFRLFVDGVQKGSAVSVPDASGYIVFDMAGSPVKLETGGRVVKVVADIVGGSSKEFYLSLRQKSDVWAVDSQYNAAVLSSSTFPIGDVDNDIEIDTGTLTITKTTDSPSGDVVKDASGVVLARFEFKAAGEKMKVENLRISNTSGTDAKLALRNATLFADGVQVGSTTTLWEDNSPAASNSGVDYAEVSLGSSLIVTPGTPRIVEIRADIYDASGTNDVAAEDTVIANLAVGSSNVQLLTTLSYANSAATVGSTLTIKTGSLSAGKYTGYANQSVVDPKTNVKVGHFTITAASSESINISSIDIMPQPVTNASFDGGELDDSYIKVYNDSGSLIYTSPNKATMSESASTSFAVSFSLPANKTYQVEVWANVESGVTTSDSVRLAFSATGTTAGSSTSSTSSVVAGQLITNRAGVLTKANGALPAARLINGGATQTGYQFTLTPTYDDFYLDEVYVDLSVQLASSTGAIANLLLKNSAGTTLATATVNATTSSASFTGLNLLMSQVDGTKTFTVDAVLANVGVGANDTAGVVTVRLDGLKTRDSAGTITTENGFAPGTYGGNANNVVKGYPTFTNSALPTSVLNAGTMTLFKTVVSATGGQVAWNSIEFTISSSSGVITIATSTWQLWENGVNINSLAVGDGITAGAVSDSYSSTNDLMEFSFATERVIAPGSPVTLELKATVGGALVATNSITAQIANPLGTTVSSDDSADQARKGASFVWSDLSAASHATTTNDWFTDGLVKTLAESQTVVK